MKRHDKIGIIILLAILLLTEFSIHIEKSNLPREKLTVNSLGSTGSGGNFAKLNTIIDRNALPKECMVYKVKKVNIKSEEVVNKARKLGIIGEIKEDEKMIRIKGENADFIVDKKTGSERYFSKLMRGDTEVRPLKNILKDEEYVKLARKFLDENGFSKPNMKLKGVNKGYRIGIIDSRGNETQLISKVEVMFESDFINGIKYTGVGPKISVWFGDDGEIIGYGSIWREIDESVKYPLITIDEAINNTKKGNALIYNISNKFEEGTIVSAEIVLWSDPDGYEQKYIIPHYHFKGVTKNGDKFTIITRAISDDYVEEVNTQKNYLPIPELSVKPN